MWLTHLIVERRRTHSAVRVYLDALRFFCDYVTAPYQGWARECEVRSGAVPVQVCRHDRTVDLLAGPGRRAMTREEVQRFLDHADDQVEKAVRRGQKRAPARYRDAALFKVVYAWGLYGSEASPLDVTDFQPHDDARELGRFGALRVRTGMRVRGLPPQRRTVVSMMPWAVDAVRKYLTDVRPRPAGQRSHPVAASAGVAVIPITVAPTTKAAAIPARDHEGGKAVTGERRSGAVLALALDVVIPLAVFYLARGAGVNQWLALLLAALAPVAGIGWAWARQRRLDATAVFVIVSMALSLLVAFVTGDARVLLARESWLTGAVGLWILGSVATGRPFLLDVAGKVSPAGVARRVDSLWAGNRVFRRWVMLASLAWGAAFLLDAVIRVVFAYTLTVDSVPAAGTGALIVLIVLAQGIVMVHGRRSGALALLRNHG
ncbi:VC0807 family protein [Nonomuraea sp. CA-141351]|uniref:VC0807 family protein n=1 Tax=Nonomuraea sp. CA-141351 TaxID=3239996 RepID=UPI003D942B75